MKTYHDGVAFGMDGVRHAFARRYRPSGSALFGGMGRG